MDTATPMVLPTPLRWRPVLHEPAPAWRRRAWWLGPLVGAVLGILVFGATVDVPYYAVAPGEARETNDLIHVDGAPVHPPQGEVDFTTVRLDRVNAFEALVGWLDPEVDVFPERAILGDTEPEQLNRVNLQAMSDSKQVAAMVALRKLGYQVGVRGQGATVIDLVPGMPAARVLQPGDVITRVGTTPIAIETDLVAAIQARKPGETVTLEVKGVDGLPRTVEVVLAARDDGSALLGVEPGTHQLEFDFPFTVTIESGEVGGPSAGLAFTLAILDTLTPDELTGGQRIAATGTIEPDGRVGPVGGVAQKVAAVKARGIRLFLVPEQEYEVARRHAGSKLRVEPVATLDDALEVLATLEGSNAMALGTPGAAR